MKKNLKSEKYKGYIIKYQKYKNGVLGASRVEPTYIIDTWMQTKESASRDMKKRIDSYFRIKSQ